MPNEEIAFKEMDVWIAEGPDIRIFREHEDNGVDSFDAEFTMFGVPKEDGLVHALPRPPATRKEVKVHITEFSSPQSGWKTEYVVRATDLSDGTSFTIGQYYPVTHDGLDIRFS
jgi:hypothetical protein